MECNPDPTKQATEVLFSCKKNSVTHPHLIFDGSAVVKINIRRVAETQMVSVHKRNIQGR